MILDMLFKKLLIVLLLIGLFGNATIVSADTSVTVSVDRVVLLQQIQKLLLEVERLQALLAVQKSANSLSYSNYVPYDLVLFPISFESVYLVQEGKLFATQKTKTVRTVDQQMFDLFVATIGEKAVNKYLREWRVFQGELENMSAFVELVPIANGWVVGVNREGFLAEDTEVVKSFINLFLHEYAHILVYEIPDFKENYQSNFWSANDLRHLKNMSQLEGRERFVSLTKYFEANPSRFVSEYATSNPDEDMAETFVYFVSEEKPKGLTTREQKILAFYQEPTMVAIREVLRKNIAVLWYFRD